MQNTTHVSVHFSSVAKRGAIALLVGIAACSSDPVPPGDDSGPTSDALTLDAGTDVRVDGGTERDAAASDAGLLDAGTDSSITFPDSGLPDPAWVDLDVVAAGECPEFTACGGDIVGVWDTSGGCFEVDIESAISRCPGARVTERSGRGRGRVIFGADGNAHRVAESQVAASVFVPAACTAFVSCESIEDLMRAQASSATCTSAPGGDCNCDATYDFALDETSPYGTEGNEITAPGKRWEYCVDGETLTYQDTSPSGTREPGTVELTRQ